MAGARYVALSALCLALSASLVQAQDLSRYRGFQFGMSLAAVAERARMAPTAARVLHERPHVIQQLDWMPQQQQLSGSAQSEAVRIVSFTFYDDRLCRISVSYDRNRVEGLTAEDFVQAISTSYGLAILASTQIGATSPPARDDLSVGSDGTVAARWEDASYSVSLVRTTYPSAFELLLLARQPDQLARDSTLASTQLDLLGAPQAEIDRQRKVTDENRVKAETARRANQPLFRF